MGGRVGVQRKRWHNEPMREKIVRMAIPEPNSGCWLWTGATNVTGYGFVTRDKVSRLAHRVSYETFVGPIPEGLEIDHLCRVRLCVNPAHLEPVTSKENSRRSPLMWGGSDRDWGKCVSGHDMTPENVTLRSNGYRCKTCDYQRLVNWRKRKRP